MGVFRGWTVQAFGIRKFRRGTTVTLHLKPVDAESGVEDFAEDWVIKRIVKQYSDFVTYPIHYRPTGKEADKKKDTPDSGPINSMKPIWTRPASEVTEDEYKEFYKHISRDWNDPLKHLSFKAEGESNIRLCCISRPKHRWTSSSKRESLVFNSTFETC